MAAVQLVADRAAFWAELGAVSAPVLLGRLGRHLAEAAAGDPEVGAALHLAASHVHQSCLVWPAGPAETAFESPRGPPKSVRPCWRSFSDGPVKLDDLSESDVAPEDSNDSSVESDAASGDFATARSPWVALGVRGTQPWLADYGAQPYQSGIVSDSIVPDGLRAFDLLLPRCCLWPARMLPVVGSLAAHVLWVIALFASVPWIFAHSWQRNNPLGVEGLSSKVGPMFGLAWALRLLVTIPLMITARRVVMDNTFDATLRADLASPNGAATKRFFQRGLGVAISILIPVGLLEFSDGVGRDWYSEFVFMRCVVSVSYLSVFSVLYKLSVNKVEGLRALIAEPEMSASFWNFATREYLAATKTIDMLWRVSGFSTALTVFLASNMLVVAMFSAIGFADLMDSSIDAWRPWCWALKLGIAMVVVLYLISNINSRCSSSRHAKGSLLYLARHHMGKSKPWCLLEHLAFIECVDGVPCGVEVAILPVLSASMFAPVIRVACVVAPVVAGFSYSAAQAGA